MENRGETHYPPIKKKNRSTRTINLHRKLYTAFLGLSALWSLVARGGRDHMTVGCFRKTFTWGSRCWVFLHGGGACSCLWSRSPLTFPGELTGALGAQGVGERGTLPPGPLL